MNFSVDEMKGKEYRGLKNRTVSAEVGCAVIVNDAGEILICQRGRKGSCPYLYEFPGGKAESGENIKDCIKREIMEELSVSVDVYSELFTGFYSYPEIDANLHFYAAKLKSGQEPKLNEHFHMEWTLPSEIMKFEFCPGDAEFIEKLACGDIKVSEYMKGSDNFEKGASETSESFDMPEKTAKGLKFKAIHQNFNVRRLDESLEFYKKALGLKEKRRKIGENSSFILVYLANDENDFEIELTWLSNRKEAYNLGDNEFHLAFSVKDFDAALKLHRDMECVCFENQEMGIYFISDPDGYWIEIVPEKASKP